MSEKPVVQSKNWATKAFEDSVTPSGPDKIILEDGSETTIEIKPVKTVGELITDFVQLRDTLSVERKAFKQLEQELKSDMEEIEAAILEKQRELGVTSLSTKDLTAFQTDKTFVRMGNWDTFSEWVLKSGNIQCIEKRPAKLACLEIEENGEDLATIGIEKTSEICVQVRKK